MRNLPRILSKVHRDPWMIRPERLHAIADLLETRLTVRADMVSDVMPSEQDDMTEDYGGARLIKVFGILGKHLSNLEMECGGCSVDEVCEQIEEAEQDPAVSEILLWFNSPGGTVTGIPEAGALIARVNATKKITALVDGECCSAAYWMASQCGDVIATPSACIGSIGVYCLLLDRSRQLENEGIKVNAISAGTYKLSGADFRPLSDDERAMFQTGVDRTYQQFKDAVNEGRSGTVADDVMQGQTFDGEEAAAVGLVDDVVVSLTSYLKAKLTPAS